MKAECLYFNAPYQVSIKSEIIEALNEDQVLIETYQSAISAGTELLLYRGDFPKDIPVDPHIRPLNVNFRYPLKYGYCLIGKVVDRGRQVDPYWNNRYVFAFHPHASHFTCNPDDLIPIPNSVPTKLGVLFPSMETALALVMDGAPMVGECVVVFGQGVIGLLTCELLARFPLQTLLTIDRYKLRRETSCALGAQASFDPDDLNSINEISPNGTDLSFELSGSPEALNQAINMTRYSGRVIIGSWYGTKRIELELGGHFHRSHIRLISSQVSTISPGIRGRWDKQRRYALAWDMLIDSQASPLITQYIPFHKAEDAYQMLDQHPESAIQIVFSYSAS
jgi:Zn-dependent alcohol dehydrogenase